MPIVDPSLHAKTLVAAGSRHAARRRHRGAAAVVRLGRVRRDLAEPHRHAAGGDLTRAVAWNRRHAPRGAAGFGTAAAPGDSPGRSLDRRVRRAARAFAAAYRRPLLLVQRCAARGRARDLRVGQSTWALAMQTAAEQDGAGRRRQPPRQHRVGRHVAALRSAAAPAAQLRVSRLRARRDSAGGDPRARPPDSCSPRSRSPKGALSSPPSPPPAATASRSSSSRTSPSWKRWPPRCRTKTIGSGDRR